MHWHALLAGGVLWLMGTLVFRFGPPGILEPPSPAQTILFYLVNAVIVIVVVRILFAWAGVGRDERPAAVSLFILPTLLLDAFATAFFPAFFPNLQRAAAPTFGGLMLISAAGAVLGAWLPW